MGLRAFPIAKFYGHGMESFTTIGRGFYHCVLPATIASSSFVRAIQGLIAARCDWSRVRLERSTSHRITIGPLYEFSRMVLC